MHHSAYSINETEQGTEIAFQMVVQGDSAILERCQKLNRSFWAEAELNGDTFTIRKAFQCRADLPAEVLENTAETFHHSQLEIAETSLTDARNTEIYANSRIPAAHELTY